MIDVNIATNLITETLKEIAISNKDSQKKKQLSAVNSETQLFGSNGILDSMDIVVLLADLEDKLETQHKISLSLADDTIMSKARSPFRSVRSLAKYIVDSVNK